MAISFSKRELEKKKQGKKLEKQQRKEERKANRGGSSLDDMIAYVDANGMITDTPPDMSSKPKVDAETIAVSVPKKEEQEPVALRGRVEHFNTDKGYGHQGPRQYGEIFLPHQQRTGRHRRRRAGDLRDGTRSAGTQCGQHSIRKINKHHFT